MSQRGLPPQIDRDYVRLLMVMQRFIRDEFNIRIAISEADATTKLLEYAEQSHNTVLQEMGKELRGMISPASHNISTEDAIVKTNKIHTYRGAVQQTKSSTGTHAVMAQQGAPAKRIYRGQVVTA